MLKDVEYKLDQFSWVQGETMNGTFVFVMWCHLWELNELLNFCWQTGKKLSNNGRNEFWYTNEIWSYEYLHYQG